MGQSLGRAPARAAIISADINDGIILTAALADSAVTAAKIAIDTIEAGDVAANAITTSELAPNAVETVNILNSSNATTGITTTKIATDAVDGTKIADNAIGNEHLEDDAVGVAELSATGTADSSVFLRGDNSWAAAGSPSITDNGNATAMTINVTEDVTYTGNIIMPTNKKVQQKGAFMQSSTHQALTLGY